MPTLTDLDNAAATVRGALATLEGAMSPSNPLWPKVTALHTALGDGGTTLEQYCGVSQGRWTNLPPGGTGKPGLGGH